MSDLDKQERRMARILGSKSVPSVNKKTLKAYRDHLKGNLRFPCFLTGIEDFPWEERYVFGFGSKAEYKELKKTQPSYYYSDVLNFNSFGHSEAFFPMRFIRDIISARMIPDNFDRSLERQRTKREDGCDQSVSLGKRQRWSFF